MANSLSKKTYTILVTVALFLLNGCVTKMTGRYFSRIDPEYHFNIDDPIIVTVEPNDLESKYYVSKVIEALKSRGFQNVYSQGNQEDYAGSFKGMLFISLKKKIDTYEYRSADYGEVDSGQSTINCYSVGNSVTCNEVRKKERGVIGYSTKTRIVEAHAFNLVWYDIYSRNHVYRIMGVSFEKKCDDEKVYSFLINQTINRADFNKPQDYEYKVKMPEGYSCK